MSVQCCGPKSFGFRVSEDQVMPNGRDLTLSVAVDVFDMSCDVNRIHLFTVYSVDSGCRVEHPHTPIKRTRQWGLKCTDNTKQPPSQTATAIIPYRKNTAERIQRVLNSCQIRTVFKADRTLHKHLVRVKDSIPSMEQRGAVHCVKCLHCEQAYVGQTGRQPKKRITEHKRYGAKQPKNPVELDKLERDSARAVHGLLEGHNIDYDNPSILERGLRSNGQRYVAEAVHITRHIKNVNRNTECEISTIWHDLILRHTKTKRLGSTTLNRHLFPPIHTLLRSTTQTYKHTSALTARDG
ncbi:unnamed protein product [Calicophoron daubneyi]|uniref:Uncharacterized protein n=1 Tax=Calicophoron daubneyi TaxID=300641 RepID=A0AAV2TIV7_CALDB